MSFIKGIDISSYQTITNWEQLKQEIDFAIIRCGYGDNIENQDDRKFNEFTTNCIKYNIPYAIYLYSYAKNLTGTESIQSEIDHCKRILNKLSVSPFCVYLDMEDDSTISLGKSTLTNFALEFCRQIKEANYNSGIYANEYWFKNYLDANTISNQGYSIWCAKYSNKAPNLSIPIDLWQYSNTNTIKGIIGPVDSNIMLNNIINKSQINVYYKVKTKKYGWLPEVKNLNDYAGWNNDPIIAVAIRVDQGNIKYRVHIKNKNWLDYVTGYNTNDLINGYAGDGKNTIDAITVYYFTPKNIKPSKKAKYRVNNYSWQYDNETTYNQDGYAGIIGQNITKFQIIIE